MSPAEFDGAAPSGHYLDVENWKRREHFELYRDFANPFFSVCVELDVTDLWQMTRARGAPSFFLATIFAALRASNSVEAFRTRIRGERVWVHDRVGITPTVLRSDETFAFARLDLAETFVEFAKQSAPIVDDACELRPIVPRPTDDVVYQTTLPWLRFTSFSNALKGEGDSVPRIAFGKCSDDRGRWKLPVSVEVHHALIDGIDVARFLEEAQREVAEIGARR
jgi:chloramphenicol O-acetyltransferase type A